MGPKRRFKDSVSEPWSPNINDINGGLAKLLDYERENVLRTTFIIELDVSTHDIVKKFQRYMSVVSLYFLHTHFLLYTVNLHGILKK